MKSIKLFAVDIDGTITINGNGAVNLEALAKLRYLVKLGYEIVYVTGRSSIEAFILSVFGGTTRISIGENGGVITESYTKHMILANRQKCIDGYNILTKEIPNIEVEEVLPRMTEVVLKRTFDIDKGNKIMRENNLDLKIVDSNYAFHINEKKVDKSLGLQYLMKIKKINHNEIVVIGDSKTDIPLFDFIENSITFENSEEHVRKKAKYIVKGEKGEGLINAIDLVIQKKNSGN